MMRMRQETRVETNVASLVRTPLAEADGSIVNISKAGCKIQTNSEFAQVGTTVILSPSSQVELVGQIIWTDQFYCGVNFYQEISEEAIDWMAAQIENPNRPMFIASKIGFQSHR